MAGIKSFQIYLELNVGKRYLLLRGRYGLFFYGKIHLSNVIRYICYNMINNLNMLVKLMTRLKLLKITINHDMYCRYIQIIKKIIPNKFDGLVPVHVFLYYYMFLLQSLNSTQTHTSKADCIRNLATNLTRKDPNRDYQ